MKATRYVAGLGICLLTSVATAQGQDADLFVDSNLTTGAQNGTTWPDAFHTLQNALAAVLPGQRIAVAEGQYLAGSSGFDLTAGDQGGIGIHGGFLGNAGLPGASTEYDAPDGSFEATVLTCTAGASGRIVDVTYLNESNPGLVTIDGFLITGGGTVILDSGGINASGGDLLVENCTISDNRSLLGGGIAFVGTRAGGGFDTASLTVRNCVISDNAASETIGTPVLGGGGIFVSNSTDVRFGNLVVRGNTATGPGGGIAVGPATDIFAANLLVHDNVSVAEGGGIYSLPGDENQVQFWSGMTVAFNKAVVNGELGVGSGMHVEESDPEVAATTTITNSIFWANQKNEAAEVDLFSMDQFNLGSSDVQQMFANMGFISLGGNFNPPVNPLFKNPAARNLRLKTINGASPCINAGGTLVIDFADVDGNGDPNEALPIDLDGGARLIGGVVDMGAFESSVVQNGGGPGQ